MPAPTIRRRNLQAHSHWPADVPPLLRRIYSARGALTPDAARPRLAHLHPPDLLGGLPGAIIHLATAMTRQQRILIVGDFDCDGATACALAVRGLRLLGARDVHHAVPNRAIHGYGLSPALVAELAPIAPDVLITVDHGIACHAGISAAKALGWTVIVTDHHLPGVTLPPADAIVNPNCTGDAFPSKALAGVGVMFYVLMALRRHLRDAGAFAATPEPDLMTLLDLVAVGTVADLVPLDANNRALVSAGLRRLRSGHGCAGLQALMTVSGRKAAQLTATDIGFALGPRINAAGRLEDMGIGIELLLTDDHAKAQEIAAILQQINTERRAVQQQMTGDAEAILSHLHQDTDAAPPIAACLFDPDWHPGVVGLVASKMKDRLHRPVIAFAPATPGADSLRGSARSIPGLHIRDVLAAVDAVHPGLIDKFGGHAMAAGLSLPLANLEPFTTAFEHAVSALADPAILTPEHLTDGALEADEFTIHNARLLRDAGPWGQGFPEPSFDGEFDIIDWRIVGTNHLKLRLRPAHGGPTLNAIHFGGGEAAPPATREHLVYRLEPDDYRGNDAIQLLVEHRQALD